MYRKEEFFITEVLECGDCGVSLNYNEKQIPKVLKCFHSFCGKCVSKMLKRDSPVCAVCNSPINSCESTIDSLQDIGFLQNIETYKQIVQVSQEESCKECQNCSDGNKATHWCADEGMPLLFCSECVNIYNSFQSRGHKLFVSLKNTRPDNILQHVHVRLSGFRRCRSHGEDLQRFCEQCMQPSCIKCDHSGHPMVSIQDEADAIRSKISHKVQDSEKSIALLRKKLKYIEEERERLEESTKITTEQVHLFFNKLKESINKREKQLLSKVSKTSLEKATTLQKDSERTRFELRDVTHFKQFLTLAKEFSNDSDLMVITGYFKSRLGEYLSTHMTDEPDANGSISFGPGKFTEIKVPLIQSKHFEEILNTIPLSVENLGEIRETMTVASETRFKIIECGSGLEVLIDAYTKTQQPCNRGGDSFNIEIKDPSGKITTPLIVDFNTGRYSANYTPKVPGKYNININFHGRPIHRSPQTFEMEGETQARVASRDRNRGLDWEDPPPPPLPGPPRHTGNTEYVTMGSGSAGKNALQGLAASRYRKNPDREDAPSPPPPDSPRPTNNYVRMGSQSTGGNLIHRSHNEMREKSQALLELYHTDIPDLDPPPPPLPSSPRPNSTGSVRMGFPEVSMSKGRSDRPLKKAMTTSSMMTPYSPNENYVVDDLDINSYIGARRVSRRGSSVYQTIDSLGLDVKKKDEEKLNALDEKDLEALRENIKPKKQRKRSNMKLLLWRKSHDE